MTQGARFQDILPRMMSGAVMAGAGLAAVWLGGWWFLALLVLIVAAMIWELVRLMAQDAPPFVAYGIAALAGFVVAGFAISGFAVSGAAVLPLAVALALLILPAVAGFVLLSARRVTFGVFATMMVLAGFGLWHLRMDFGDQGFFWMLWLALVVVVTDLGGYFAGRMIGGPKIWPAVSPKKTWSGAVAGWIGSAVVGLAFVGLGGTGFWLIAISVALSIASQIGDVAESALKRSVGAKDASGLIPGHGGVMDRFDGMIGAALFLLLIERIADFPPVGG